MKAIFVTLSIALAGMAPRAQDLVVKAPPQQRPVVLENAVIHPVSGPDLARGWIRFEGGVIRGLGEGDASALDGDPVRVDLAGKHVYPGLISAVTTIGLVEIGQVPATRDEDEIGEITPEVRAAIAVNPDSAVIPVTRSNGVLAAGVFPTGGLVPGRASVICLEGWTSDEMAIAPAAGVVVSWPAQRSDRGRRRPRGGEAQQAERQDRTEEQRETIRAVFADAQRYIAARAADPTVPTDIRREALRQALSREQPVFVRADELEQIQSAVSWALQVNLRMVLVGGRDAPLCLELLRRHDIPVIVGGTHNMPRRQDSAYDEPFRLPALLEEAGLRWCLASTGTFYNERNLPYEAATAVAFGLPKEAALRAITLSAAAILGVGDRLGSLETGKSATLIVTDGDPLLIPTKVEFAFIHGRQIDLSNKQTALAEKYREKYRQLGLWPK